MGYLEEYKKAIDKGEYIVGQELKIIINRLINDIKEKKYIFDTTESNRRIKFIEKFVKLTKSPYYNKPIKLMLWQKAFIEAVYSFKMLDGHDRFKSVLLLVSRKNGKSELISSIGLSDLFLGNAGSDIVCSSNDEKQASIVYDSIDTMRVLIDINDKYTKRNQSFIKNKINNSKIFKLSDKTRNKEGRNIDTAFIDETHEMKDDVIVKSIEMSQSLKENPKLIEITTEGFILDGHLDNKLRRARKIINGESDNIADERFLPWLYTQDSESEVWNGNRENRLWTKSNPSLGTLKKWEYLEEQVELAKTSKSDRLFVLSKDFNIKQSESERWLELEDYDYECGFDIEELRGSLCIGACDLSQTTDLTCAKVLILKNNKKYILTKYFIPESKLEKENDDSVAGAKYVEWCKDGLIDLSDGNDNQLSKVADWFYSLYEKYDIKLWKCGYDQKFSKEWITQMNEYGWTKEGKDLEVVLQNAETLSNAMKLCEADFKKHLIYYNNNKIDKWCLSNAGVKIATNGTVMCVKIEPKKRIDGAVTFCILYEMYRRYRNELLKYGV